MWIILDGVVDREFPLDFEFRYPAQPNVSQDILNMGFLRYSYSFLKLPTEGMTRNDILQASAPVWTWLIIGKISPRWRAQQKI